MGECDSANQRAIRLVFRAHAVDGLIALDGRPLVESNGSVATASVAPRAPRPSSGAAGQSWWLTMNLLSGRGDGCEARKSSLRCREPGRLGIVGDAAHPPRTSGITHGSPQVPFPTASPFPPRPEHVEGVIRALADGDLLAPREIAQRSGLTLTQVMVALNHLERAERLRVVRQSASPKVRVGLADGP